MKPLSPHDPLDEIIAAALHGELSPEERASFDSRMENDPAARAAYQEALVMHDLLEKTHQSAQPDPAFEQRMVSGVRRKIQNEGQETAWESVLVLWRGLKRGLAPRWPKPMEYVAVLLIMAILAGVALGPITAGIKKSQMSQLAMQRAELQAQVEANEEGITLTKVTRPSGASASPDQILDQMKAKDLRLTGGNLFSGGSTTMTAGNLVVNSGAMASPIAHSMDKALADSGVSYVETTRKAIPLDGYVDTDYTKQFAGSPQPLRKTRHLGDYIQDGNPIPPVTVASATPPAPAANAPASIPPGWSRAADKKLEPATNDNSQPAPDSPAPNPDPSRKLIRNAQLDLEVKSFQVAMDAITGLTRSAGGYVDTSNSQKGGNGKLQGTVVVKVLPQNLDAFLVKLRDLGELANQSVGTEDVTKDYYDTQARLVNSQKMEAQLQDLLKRTNGKVSELLQVERELGRVRGEIEQMQGSLKMYDFQVQYATVTIQMHEKDLNQAAAYLLREQDNFSLFATDVEATFQKARTAADDFKAQVLQADLNHNSGSDVSAELVVMVAPEQIESFLGQVRSLGRVDNFTRETQRVAKDGGDSSQPADQTLTEKDKVQVHLSIRSDDETRKQVALTVVTPAVDTAFEAAKTAALAEAGTSILASSLNKTPEGQSSAQLTVRVPGQAYTALMDSLRAMGRTASLSIQRNDNSGPGANGDDAPVIVSLSLTDNETPLQETDLAIVTSDVDAQAQQLKKDAVAAGAEVKASSFARQPDGTEAAQLEFRIAMGKYAAFLETLKKAGKVESLTVQRQDRPDQAGTDDSAPVEISLRLHNQGEIVPDNGGLWATLRETFAEGAGALFSSVRVIGVIAAYLIPWVFVLGLMAWTGRRIYLWKKGRK